MKIRNGIFTLYKGKSLFVTEKRIEIPISDEEKEYLVHYVDTNCPYDGFIKSNHGGFYRIVHFKDLDNLFSVKTLGIYKGKKVEVFEKNLEDNKIVGIVSKDSSIAKELEMLELEPYKYIKDINVDKLEKIWEERFPVYNLPMPKGLKVKLYLKT